MHAPWQMAAEDEAADEGVPGVGFAQKEHATET